MGETILNEMAAGQWEKDVRRLAYVARSLDSDSSWVLPFRQVKDLARQLGMMDPPPLTIAPKNDDVSPRLNPECPVCGEDEPEMVVAFGEWEGKIPLKEAPRTLRCTCRRCGWSWQVEPLSKPWEQKE